MNTSINEASIACNTDGAAGANANNINKAFKNLHMAVRTKDGEIGGLRETVRDLQEECDKLKRYHKEERNLYMIKSQ